MWAQVYGPPPGDGEGDVAPRRRSVWSYLAKGEKLMVVGLYVFFAVGGLVVARAAGAEPVIAAAWMSVVCLVSADSTLAEAWQRKRRAEA